MDISSLVSNIVNQAIVRPMGGSGSNGINGFVFDIAGDEETSFDSEITDHFIEKNYSIQDHIALRPPRFTVTGFVGELNDIFQIAFLNVLTTVQSMGMLGEYTPQFTIQATQIYNKIQAIASQVGTVLNEASNIYSTFIGVSTAATRQQSAYNFFVNLWLDRTLCSVETPWAVWPNMAIENIRILQRDGNKYVSEFSVTFKQIRVVSTQSTSLINFALNGASQIDKSLTRSGSPSDYTASAAYTAQSVAGQVKLDNGTNVDTGILSKAFAASGYGL
jgi:hypothetical protein